MEDPEASENAAMVNGDNRNDVTRASYPLPVGLTERLRLAASAASAADGSENSVETESIQAALAELVSNSLEAMDAMYFSRYVCAFALRSSIHVCSECLGLAFRLILLTISFSSPPYPSLYCYSPPHVRGHECFQHRLCIRVRADVEEQTLTITDLGAGMTRADLINSLGIGRQIQSSNKNKNKSNDKKAAVSYESSSSTSEEEEEDDDEEFSSDDVDEGEGEEGEQSDEMVDTENNNKQEQEQQVNGTADEARGGTVSCKVSDIGGFYAAVCALALGVRVGTKVRKDARFFFATRAILYRSWEPKFIILLLVEIRRLL